MGRQDGSRLVGVTEATPAGGRRFGEGRLVESRRRPAETEEPGTDDEGCSRGAGGGHCLSVLRTGWRAALDLAGRRRVLAVSHGVSLRACVRVCLLACLLACLGVT